jgi:nitrile hydratase subunit beta
MRFAAGTPVRIRRDFPELRGPCHIRTPHYLRGLDGTVERPLGAYPNPEDLAFARPAARVPLYHVRFEQPKLFGEGARGDTLLVEVFEHWLEEAEPSDGRRAAGPQA